MRLFAFLTVISNDCLAVTTYNCLQCSYPRTQTLFGGKLLFIPIRPLYSAHCPPTHHVLGLAMPLLGTTSVWCHTRRFAGISVI